MVAFTIMEMLFSIFIGLVYYSYVEVQGFNLIVSSIFHTHLVIATLEYNMLTVIMYGIMSLPLALILGAVIYSFSRVSYLTGWS